MKVSFDNLLLAMERPSSLLDKFLHVQQIQLASHKRQCGRFPRVGFSYKCVYLAFLQHEVDVFERQVMISQSLLDRRLDFRLRLFDFEYHRQIFNINRRLPGLQGSDLFPELSLQEEEARQPSETFLGNRVRIPQLKQRNNAHALNQYEKINITIRRLVIDARI